MSILIRYNMLISFCVYEFIWKAYEIDIVNKKAFRKLLKNKIYQKMEDDE